jgi:hypothetical protein
MLRKLTRIELSMARLMRKPLISFTAKGGETVTYLFSVFDDQLKVNSGAVTKRILGDTGMQSSELVDLMERAIHANK